MEHPGVLPVVAVRQFEAWLPVVASLYLENVPPTVDVHRVVDEHLAEDLRQVADEILGSVLLRHRQADSYSASVAVWLKVADGWLLEYDPKLRVRPLLLLPHPLPRCQHLTYFRHAHHGHRQSLRYRQQVALLERPEVCCSSSRNLTISDMWLRLGRAETKDLTCRRKCLKTDLPTPLICNGFGLLVHQHFFF